MARPPFIEELPCDLDGLTLVHRLATGGMAEIYLAIDDPPLGGRRFVVVKRIRGDYADDENFVHFFLTEGRVSMKCHHPNLPQAYRLGSAAGRPYLTLEYIHGHTALAVMRAASRFHAPLSPGSAAAIALGGARALEHLHGLTDLDGSPLNVVHRDVTPQNLMVSSDGVIKLIDLGVARAALQTHETQVGVIKGKYAYIAPEQLGTPPMLDQRADLFSLGVVFHELLVGRPLFHGASDLDTCDRVRYATVPDPSSLRPDVPRALSEVVLRALAREPDQRWQSAAAMVTAIEEALEESGAGLAPATVATEVAELVGAAPRPLLGPRGLRWAEPDDDVSAIPRVAHAGATERTEVEHDDDNPTSVFGKLLADVEAGVGPIDAGLGGDEDDAGDHPRDPMLAYFLAAGAVRRSDGGPGGRAIG